MSLAALEDTTTVTAPTGRGRTPMVPLTVSDEVGTGSVLYMPSVRAAVRHALPVLIESIVIPLIAYYCALMVAGFRGALIGVLAWSYVLVGRRLWRHERVSTMLLLGTLLFTLRTGIAFATGSVFLYFIQPTASAFVASFLLVGSALLGRPFTQRFTHDFCPLSPEFLARPNTQRFFVRVSFLWAATMLLNGALVPDHSSPCNFKRVRHRAKRHDSVGDFGSGLPVSHLVQADDDRRRNHSSLRHGYGYGSYLVRFESDREAFGPPWSRRADEHVDDALGHDDLLDREPLVDTQLVSPAPQVAAAANRQGLLSPTREPSPVSWPRATALSAFFTKPEPARSRRSFWRVNSRSPSFGGLPVGHPQPLVRDRSGRDEWPRANRFSSASVPTSAPIMRSDCRLRCRRGRPCGRRRPSQRGQ